MENEKGETFKMANTAQKNLIFQIYIQIYRQKKRRGDRERRDKYVSIISNILAIVL